MGFFSHRNILDGDYNDHGTIIPYGFKGLRQFHRNRVGLTALTYSKTINKVVYIMVCLTGIYACTHLGHAFSETTITDKTNAPQVSEKTEPVKPKTTQPEKRPQSYEDKSQLALQETFGYRIIETPNGKRLKYFPALDQSLSGNFHPDPTMENFLKVQKLQTAEIFNNFLVTKLTPAQRKLLQDYLITTLLQIPEPTAQSMASELQSAENSPASMAYMARIVLALYYYTTYIYEPLIDFAGNTTLSGYEGLIMPQILGMTHYLLDLFPGSYPFTSIVMVAPVVVNLLATNYMSGQMATGISSASYALLLGLAAQVSSGLLGKLTTFNSYGAGLLAGSYRNYQNGRWLHAAIDGVLTLQMVPEKRGLIYSAAIAGLMNATGQPPRDMMGASYFSANHMIPAIISVCLTRDWASSFITGVTLALNQYGLYAPRDKFLEPGKLYKNNVPWFGGMLGSGIMMGLATATFWNDMPGLREIGASFNATTSEVLNWVGYLTFLKGTGSPDGERSGIIQSLTNHWASISPWAKEYRGEIEIEPENSFSNPEQRFAGSDAGMSQSFSRWFSQMTGYQRDETEKTDVPALLPENDSLEVEGNLPESSPIESAPPESVLSESFLPESNSAVGSMTGHSPTDSVFPEKISSEQSFNERELSEHEPAGQDFAKHSQGEQTLPESNVPENLMPEPDQTEPGLSESSLPDGAEEAEG